MSSPYSPGAIAEGMLRAKQTGGAISQYITSPYFANLSEADRREALRIYLADERAHRGMGAKARSKAIMSQVGPAMGDAVAGGATAMLAATLPGVMSGASTENPITRAALKRGATIAGLGIILPSLVLSATKGALRARAFDKANADYRDTLSRALESEDPDAGIYEAAFKPKLPKEGRRVAIVNKALAMANKGDLVNMIDSVGEQVASAVPPDM